MTERTSNKQILDAIVAQGEALSALVTILTAQSLQQQAAPAAPVVQAEPEAKTGVIHDAKVLEAKWNTQVPRAKALAKKNGKGAELWITPKGAVWYVAKGRRVNGTKMVTFNPDGSTETHVSLGNLKIA